MSLSQLIEDHADSLVFRTDRFSESVYRSVSGRRQKELVTCNVTWDKPQAQGNLGQVSFTETGTLTVAPGDWSTNDTWFIGERSYRVTSVSVAQHGTQEITIVRKASSDRTTALGIL